MFLFLFILSFMVSVYSNIVNCGWGHCCAIQFDKTVWCWGKDDYGQLGTNTIIKKKMKVNPFLLKCCLYPMLPLFVVGLTIRVFYKILPYYVLEILILDKWEAELIPRLLNLLLSILPLLLAFHKFHVAIKQLVL